MSRFWGLRSLWRIPLLCRTFMARAICCRKTRMVSSLSVPLAEGQRDQTHVSMAEYGFKGYCSLALKDYLTIFDGFSHFLSTNATDLHISASQLCFFSAFSRPLRYLINEILDCLSIETYTVLACKLGKCYSIPAFSGPHY